MLSPGPELNKEIAELLGWKRIVVVKGVPTGMSCWYLPNGTPIINSKELPNFSKDICAAMMKGGPWEKLKQRNEHISINFDDGEYFIEYRTPPFSQFMYEMVEGESEAHAICLAYKELMETV